jgi:hypothetical protein
MAMNPVVRNPTSAGMGRAFPAAGYPNVTFAIPAMVAIDPHEPPLRGTAALFDDRGRWPNANHNLRI